MGDGRLGLFTVGLQYTLACRAQPLAIALQAAKNGEDVALVGPQLRHAVSGHIAMTGRAVLLTSLHRARTLRCRRLRWELGRGGRDAGQQQGQAQNQSAMHDFRSPTAKPLPVDSVAHVPRSRMSRTSCHQCFRRAARREACASRPRGDTSRGRAVSSVGRASALHAECRRFESVIAHHASPCGLCVAQPWKRPQGEVCVRRSSSEARA